MSAESSELYIGKLEWMGGRKEGRKEGEEEAQDGKKGGKEAGFDQILRGYSYSIYSGRLRALFSPGPLLPLLFRRPLFSSPYRKFSDDPHAAAQNKR